MGTWPRGHVANTAALVYDEALVNFKLGHLYEMLESISRMMGEYVQTRGQNYPIDSSTELLHGGIICVLLEKYSRFSTNDTEENHSNAN